MFAIDIFLIVGIIIGAKLDEKRMTGRRHAPSKAQSAIIDEKEYEGKDKDMDDSNKALTAEQSVPVAQMKQGAPKFWDSFLIYHRLLNICASNYHVIQRPARVFSLALQLALLCNIVGLLTFVSFFD